jgi:hypothetical protein
MKKSKADPRNPPIEDLQGQVYQHELGDPDRAEQIDRVLEEWGRKASAKKRTRGKKKPSTRFSEDRNNWPLSANTQASAYCCRRIGNFRASTHVCGGTDRRPARHTAFTSACAETDTARTSRGSGAGKIPQRRKGPNPPFEAHEQIGSSVNSRPLLQCLGAPWLCCLKRAFRKRS